MEMFDQKTLRERIGSLKKSKSLNVLKQVEKYALKRIKEVGLDASYDVIADEPYDFWTMGYTEYANHFIFQPLSFDIRTRMITDALNDHTEYATGYAQALRDYIENDMVNKYQHRKKTFDKYPARKYLVVLPGSNKIKSHVCLNKLRWIKDKYLDDVYFKPHPLTTHAVIGELKDFFGEDSVLPRDIDMYYYLQKADKVFTTHMSETASYAVALGKEIEPVDVYNHLHEGSFFNINKVMFDYQDDPTVIDRVFSSYKSGIINPVLDRDWKKKIDKYLDYILEYKSKRSNWFIVEKKDGKKEV